MLAGFTNTQTVDGLCPGSCFVLGAGNGAGKREKARRVPLNARKYVHANVQKGKKDCRLYIWLSHPLKIQIALPLNSICSDRIIIFYTFIILFGASLRIVLGIK